RTDIPGAGPPLARSRTCVVIMIESRGDLIEQLRQPQPRDLPLLFGSDAQFLRRVVAQPLLEQVQHLARGFSRRADDEDVAETGFVLLIRPSEPPPNIVVSTC